MEFQPINLPELVGTAMGMLIILIPVAGATLRYAVKPLVDALLQSGVLGPRHQTNDADLARLSRRVLELEQALAQRKIELPLPVEGPTSGQVDTAHRLRSA